MLRPEGIFIYLIMIMASLKWAGEMMLSACATFVVQNKINDYLRKWIKRAQRGFASKLVCIMDLDEEFKLSDRHLILAHCCFVCRQISYTLSGYITEKTSDGSLTWSVKSTAPPIELSSKCTSHCNSFSVCSPAPRLICIDSSATAPGDVLTQVSFSIEAPRSSLVYVCVKAPKLYSISKVPVLQRSSRNTCLEALGMTS